jgi:hypothetical protein
MVSNTDANALLEISNDKQSNHVTVRKVKLLPKKDIYMHSLLWINEDFDDDLLIETLELLNCDV